MKYTSRAYSHLMMVFKAKAVFWRKTDTDGNVWSVCINNILKDEVIYPTCMQAFSIFAAHIYINAKWGTVYILYCATITAIPSSNPERKNMKGTRRQVSVCTLEIFSFIFYMHILQISMERQHKHNHWPTHTSSKVCEVALAQRVTAA